MRGQYPEDVKGFHRSPPLSENSKDLLTFFGSRSHCIRASRSRRESARATPILQIRETFISTLCLHHYRTVPPWVDKEATGIRDGNPRGLRTEAGISLIVRPRCGFRGSADNEGRTMYPSDNVVVCTLWPRRKQSKPCQCTQGRRLIVNT
jgi:hypothetical protein